MKKLLTNKKLMSCLSLVLVLAMVITNLHLGGVRAKAEESTPSLSLNKTVTGSGDNYTIDLKTEGKSIKNEKTNKTDVVLVIDKSSSMYGDKLTKVKEAAKTFVNTVTADGKGNVRVSVVAYGASAGDLQKDVYSFTEGAPTSGFDYMVYIDNNSNADFEEYDSDMGNVVRYNRVGNTNCYVKNAKGSYAFGYWSGFLFWWDWNNMTPGTFNSEKYSLYYDDSRDYDFIEYVGSMENATTRYNLYGNNYYYPDANGQYVFGKVNVTQEVLGFSSNSAEVISAIDKITTTSNGQGTNTQAGLAKAEQILNTSAAPNKVVVLLSDGAATYHYKVSSYDASTKTATFSNDRKGNGSDFKLETSYTVNGIKIENNGKPAEMQAQNIKNKGTKIYTIGYCDNSTNLINTMKNIATSDDYYRDAPSTDTIEETFRNIAKEINYISVSKGTFTDLVPAYFDVMNGQNVVENGTFTNKDGLTINVEKLGDGTKRVTCVVTNLTYPAKEDKKTTDVKFDIKLNKTKLLEIANADAVAFKNNYYDSTKDVYKLPTNVVLPSGHYAQVDYELSNKVAGQADADKVAYADAGKPAEVSISTVTVNYREDAKDGKILETVTRLAMKNEDYSFADLNAYVTDKARYNKKQTSAYKGTTTISRNKSGNWHFTVTGDTTIDVVYVRNTFTVDYYKNSDKKVKVIDTQTVKYGDAATAPSRDKTDALTYTENGYRYTFDKWSDNNISSITENKQIYAEYTNQIIKYTVNFWTYDNTEKDFVVAANPEVSHGSKASAEGITVANKTVELNDGVDYEKFNNKWYVKTADGDVEFDLASTAVTGELNLYAGYTPVMKTFTVQFYKLDGTTVITDEGYTQTVEYGKKATYKDMPEAFKTYKTDGANAKIWTFKGWNYNFDNVVTDNVDIYPTKTYVDRYYTVTWNEDNGKTEYPTSTVEYNNDATYTGTPVKTDSNGEWRYTFVRWEVQDEEGLAAADKTVVSGNTVKNVKTNVTVKAIYSAEKIQYTYTFTYWDENGVATSSSITGPIGTAITKPNVPTVVTTDANGSVTTKSFAAWSPSVPATMPVNGGSSEASDTVVKEHPVTFTYNGTSTNAVLVVENNKANDKAPSAEMLKKASDKDNDYDFAYWTVNGERVDLSTYAITAPTEFVAVYNETPIVYTITVKRVLRRTDGTSVDETITTLKGQHNAYVSAAAIDEDAIYSSNGYKYSFDEYGENVSVANGAFTYGPIKGDKNETVLIYFNELPKYRVTYYASSMDVVTEGSLDLARNNTTNVIGYSEAVYAGESIVKDENVTAYSFEKTNAKWTYEFDGTWRKADGSAFTDTVVNGNVDVYASITGTINEYEVIFMDYDDDPSVPSDERNYFQVGQTQHVKYGEDAVIPTLTAQEDTAQYKFSQPTWNITQINPIHGKTTAYAVRGFEVKSYTVKFFDETGVNLVTMASIQYGSQKAAPDVPAKADSADGHYTYVDAKWVSNDSEEKPLTNELNSVKGDLEFKASYTAEEKQYTVVFMDYDPIHNIAKNFEDGEMKVVVTWGAIVGDHEVVTNAIAAAEKTAKDSLSDKVYTWSFTGFKEATSDGFGADFNKNAEVKTNITYVATYSDAKNAYNFVYLNEKIEEKQIEVITKSQIEEFVFGKDLTPAGAYEVTPAAVRTTGPAKESTETQNFTFIGWKLFTGKVIDDIPVVEDNNTSDENRDEAPSELPDRIEVIALRRVAPLTLADNNVGDESTVEESLITPPAVELENEYVIETLEGVADLVRGLRFVASEVYLVPVYAESVRTYKVDFVDYDGSLLKTQEVEFEQAATAPANPTRDGYTFKGWDKDFSKVTADMTVTAQYNQNGGGGYYYPPTPNPDPTNDNPPAENPPAEQPEMNLDPDEQALGDAVIPEEEPEDMSLDEDPQALGDALVKTGTVPVAVYYGFGATLMLAALFLAFRKKREEA